MKPHADRAATGAAGESRARAFLEGRGLVCLDAGWRCRLGELDLVMHDGEVLVFVEVRARAAGSAVDALSSIDPAKRSRFVRAARAWLAGHPQQAELPARFDIVAIDGEQIRWLPAAFDTTAW